MTDVFQEVRESVTAEDAARHYGLTFDRKGWAVCPFHQDKHPSMSFRAGRFRCWACNESGDSIDFTGKLLGLAPLDAVSRLNDDFGLDLPLHRQATEAEKQAAQRRLQVARAHKAFEEWRSNFIVCLNTAYRVGHLAIQRITSPEDSMSDQEIMAVQLMPYLEYLSDVLSFGEPKEQAKIYKQRGEITRWIGKILRQS